jgi:hypothetical protein
MNRSENLYIDHTEESAAQALKMADEFLAIQDINRKTTIRLRLLVEETIGMVKAMTGDFNALFHMEEDNGEFRIVLTCKTLMDKEKKSSLLSVSSSGKNAAVKGFMGKISEIIENGILNFDDVMKLNQQYGGGSVDYMCMGMGSMGTVPLAVPVESEPVTWSLSNYRNALEESSDNNTPAKEAWDELEKSIVANIAKDVIVGVKKDRVDVTIIA